MAFASVCVLSYERPHLLRACLESLREAGEPYELIIHDDGSNEPEVRSFLYRLADAGMVSTLLLNAPEHNEGVGEAVRRCFAVAQGDILVKVDQDLVFTPGWLTETRRILEDLTEPLVGAVGSFAYHHDPCDVAKNTVPGGQRSGYFIVEDFVGSSFAVPRDVYENPNIGPIEAHADSFSEDVGLKERAKAEGYVMALPDENLAVNVGFGVGPSTVNIALRDDGSVETQAIKHEPCLMPGSWS